MTIYGLLESNENEHEALQVRFIRFNDDGYGPFADSRKRVTRKDIARLKRASRPSRYSETPLGIHSSGMLIECIPHGEVISLIGYDDATMKFARTEMAEKSWWCLSCASDAGRDLKQDTSEVGLKPGELLLMPDVLGPRGGQRAAGGIYELTTSNRGPYALTPKEFTTNARIAGRTISSCEKWVHDIRETMFLIEGTWYRVHWLSLSASTSWHGSGPLLLEPDPHYKAQKITANKQSIPARPDLGHDQSG